MRNNELLKINKISMNAMLESLYDMGLAQNETDYSAACRRCIDESRAYANNVANMVSQTNHGYDYRTVLMY